MYPFRQGKRFASPTDIRPLVMRLTTNSLVPYALVNAHTSEIVKMSDDPTRLSAYLTRNNYRPA